MSCIHPLHKLLILNDLEVSYIHVHVCVILFPYRSTAPANQVNTAAQW